MKIDGETKLVGLIGYPVEHSRSPAMHNAAFRALGMNWRYVPLPVPPGQVEAAIQGLVALGFQGANITIPHKEAVIPVLDRLSPEAKALGAVNTLVIQREGAKTPLTIGHNTDSQGFTSALTHGGFRITPDTDGKSAVVIGAGGAARAVVYGLLKAGMRKITILNRTEERAGKLADDLQEHFTDADLVAAALTPETLTGVSQEADLLVNATSVGMWPDTGTSIWPEGVSMPSHLTVFDLVYNPLQTRLLTQAKKSGAQGIDGLGMLVQQGALAFALWTGMDGPVKIMRDNVRRDNVRRET